MTEQVLIALGSNINRERNLPRALELLRRDTRWQVLAESPIYQTPAVGGSTSQPDYFNAATLLETSLTAEALRRALRRIEARLGRVRTADKYAPRTIDLDIVFVRDREMMLDGSPVPDPDILDHHHLAFPLADVAPDWRFPGTDLTLKQIADRLRPTALEIRKMTPKTKPAIKMLSHYGTDQIFEAEDNEIYDPEFEELIRQILVRIGEDPEREGLKRTPLRVAKAYDFLTSGYTTTVEEVVNNAVFSDGCDEMVIVKDIEFYSMCEHHMIPFFGRVHVGYLPKGKVIGLSKVARIVDVFSRRLQIQERMTNQIADAMVDILAPMGVGVVVEASHLCMMMRGVQKQNSSTITSAMRGLFKKDARTRAEFMNLISDR
jgi:GTP cyclohydrolase I